jgi:hypothetical protein
MPPPRFQVVLTGAIEARIERWALWADAQGTRAHFDKALATMNYRLAYEADEWGTRENKKEMDGPVKDIRNGTVLMLNIRYGIAPAHGIVFLTGLEWREDYPARKPPA